MYDLENQYSDDRVERWFGVSNNPELLVFDRDENLPERMCSLCQTMFRYWAECPECHSISCDVCVSWKSLVKRRKDFTLRYTAAYCKICGTLLEVLY